MKIGSTVFVVQSNDMANLKNMPLINKKTANVTSFNLGGALEEEKTDFN